MLDPEGYTRKISEYTLNMLVDLETVAEPVGTSSGMGT